MFSTNCDTSRKLRRQYTKDRVLIICSSTQTMKDVTTHLICWSNTFRSSYFVLLQSHLMIIFKSSSVAHHCHTVYAWWKLMCKCKWAKTWTILSERELTFTFAICRRPSVRLSVCLSSVCNVRAPHSGYWNFRQCFYAIWYLCHLWPSDKNFTEIFPEEPLRRGWNQRGVAKYSDFWTFPRLYLGNGAR